MINKRQLVYVARQAALTIAAIVLLCQLCNAQLCSGSLGDPVVNITFGAGQDPGRPLAAATTNYTYTSNNCPPDGSYTVASSSGGCYADTWHTLHNDHTGDKNGYYMLVNASFEAGLFYLDTVHGLCGNTTYEFAAWIINLLKPNTSVCGATGIMPNITFSIEKLNGSVIQSYTTGDIAPTDSIKWTQFGFYFTTQPNLSDVVIRMKNNAPGGCGNDLAMDDITFRPCGPMANIDIAGNLSSSNIRVCLDSAKQKVLLNSAVSPGYDDPAYQWQQSIDSGKTWLDMANENARALNLLLTNTMQPGLYLYRLTLAEAQNIASIRCRIVSNVDTVILGIVPMPFITSNSPQCAGSSVVLSATGGATYYWNGPGNFNSSKDSVLIVQASAGNAGEYYVKVTSSQGCSVTRSSLLTVYTVTANAGNDTTVCEGTTVKLKAGGGQTYNWQPGSSLSSDSIANPLAKPVDTTQYTVIVGQNGCFDTATVTVNVLKNLLVSGSSSVCAGNEIILSADNGKTYSWTGPGGFKSAGDSIKIAVASSANAGEYYARDTTDKACVNTDSIAVTVIDPAAQAGKDTALCAGSSVQLNGSGNGSYTWWPATGLSAANILNPIASPAATTAYVLTVTQNGCMGKDSVMITVFNKLTASNNGPLCAGATITLTANGGGAYKWTGPAGFTALGQPVNITNAIAANAGMYFVMDTTDKVCNGSVSTNVVIADPQVSAGNDTTICKGAQVQLKGSGNGILLWQPSTGLSATNIANPVLTAKETVEYILTVAENGCSIADTVDIKVQLPVTVNAGMDKAIIEGQSVMLDGSISDAAATYYWSPGLYMQDSAALTPLVSPPSDIVYVLNAMSGNSCGNVADSVFIKVYKKVVIPNVFSPNGDGINDTWQITALAAYSNADVDVFNRYGQRVFHSTGYSRPWDGTYNNQPLPVATYYYIINLKNNSPVLSGWVAILR